VFSDLTDITEKTTCWRLVLPVLQMLEVNINDGCAEEKSGRWRTAAFIAWNCQYWPESLLCWLWAARANICQHDNRFFHMYILQWTSVSFTAFSLIG